MNLFKWFRKKPNLDYAEMAKQAAAYYGGIADPSPKETIPCPICTQPCDPENNDLHLVYGSLGAAWFPGHRYKKFHKSLDPRICDSEYWSDTP